ncbi:hypothetical protein SAMN05216361_0420 [Marisediminitalea aggregata]|uniref:Phospholipase_D-nuclease N-terminal n=1 Tax=Marisediminitalea aggregata TaxID=634436 RepID=A0A1M5EJU3_9ALTE|nr:hypothetical protein [Marisediminitalea aggregata]MEC7469119.1 hypothetical protein [Pseudomonadota bacterium]MEC7824239.1 hypothetical protein [Pseudomonadota bacterium]SHF79341.1 hypothetical protein SAMN05216361_0420 [Marisediminitalea aggregata]
MEKVVFLLVVLTGFLFNVLPWLCALCSRKASGAKKLIWFLLSFFGSWLGYAVYYFLIVKPEWEDSTARRNKRVPRNENGMPIKMVERN